MSGSGKELAATVLLEAMYTTDALVCQRYDVSVRTVQRWRQQLGEGDTELAALVAEKKATLDARWAETLPGALMKGIQTIQKCYDEVSSDADARKNPAVITAIASAVRICAEVHLTGRLIDAKLADFALPVGSGNGRLQA